MFNHRQPHQHDFMSDIAFSEEHLQIVNQFKRITWREKNFIPWSNFDQESQIRSDLNRRNDTRSKLLLQNFLIEKLKRLLNVKDFYKKTLIV